MATKAYDRVKNANNISDNFLKTPYWTPEAEDHFQKWMTAKGMPRADNLLVEYLLTCGGVSFKLIDGSVCCTLINGELREKLAPHLLTGWSDNWETALYVAHYKLTVQLDGEWESVDTSRKVPRR